MTIPIAEAGGIVFRNTPTGVQYLLVRAKRDPSQWIFPKGHVEPGEAPAAAALREVREEAGVEARVVTAVGAVEFSLAGNRLRVDFLLMEFVRRVPSPEEREQRWCEYEEARQLLSFPEARDLLQQARAKLPGED